MKLFFVLLTLLLSVAHAAAPVVSATATRTCDGVSNICVAPVAVLMNASDSTADTLADGRTAFHSLNFVHQVSTSDGSTASTATYGPNAGQKLSFMRGPMAAYVFTSAGTYTWTVCAQDSNLVQYCDTPKTFVITSADSFYSGTNTTCLANGAEPVAGVGGCPAGAAVAGSITDFDAAMTTYAGTNKRVMFKAGDTFLASTPVALAAGSALTSYGTGRAIVQPAGANAITNNNGVVNDMRVYGIEFDGNNVAGSTLAIFNTVAWTNWLFYDNVVKRFPTALNGLNMNSSGAQGVYIANSRFESPDATMTNDMILISSGNNVVILNNYINQESVGQQVLRLNFVQNVVIAHNYISGSGGTDKEMISLRPSNDIQAKNGMVWSNELVPTLGYTAAQVGSTATTEQTTDYIFEGNYVHAAETGGNKNAFDAIGYRISYRNNILDLSSTKFTGGIPIRATVTAATDLIWMDNNTFYANRATVALTMITLNATTGTTFYARNNLGYCTGGASCTMVSDLDGALVQTTNTGDVGTISTNPFLTTPTSTLTTFQPSTAYADDGGTAVFPATKSDFFNCWDKTSSVNRIGAVVPRANAICRGAP